MYGKTTEIPIKPRLGLLNLYKSSSDLINEVRFSENEISFLVDRVIQEPSFKEHIKTELAGTDKSRELARKNYKAVLEAYEKLSATSTDLEKALKAEPVRTEQGERRLSEYDKSFLNKIGATERAATTEKLETKQASSMSS